MHSAARRPPRAGRLGEMRAGAEAEQARTDVVESRAAFAAAHLEAERHRTRDAWWAVLNWTYNPPGRGRGRGGRGRGRATHSRSV